MKGYFSLIVLVCLISCSKADRGIMDENDTANPISPSSFNVNKETLLQLVNNVRKSGCNCGSTAMPPVPPITWNDLLANAAYNHSLDMKQNDYFSHSAPDGSRAGDRITSAGYEWTRYGENIAKGYDIEKDVINEWLGSETHCKNIMDGLFKEMGVARVGAYWTQVFASK